jgi:glycosyltransferase involved in cell wall biosynthesis
MHCPGLKELPPAPAGKNGWPWTEESTPLATSTADGKEWPRVTIVTPSFNQGVFLEETIRSVLLQGYPDLEYIVMDGGSKDNSIEIIKKYSPWLTSWVSEPDGGQSNAINRGLRQGSGLFATWINSDDMLCRNALTDHARMAGFDSQKVYLGICLYIDEKSRTQFAHRGKIYCLEDLVRIKSIWRNADDPGHIVQPEVLFPRELALAVGGLDTANHRTMDYELWGKFFLAGAKFAYTDVPFGMFRLQPEQKTQDGLRQTQSLLAVARKLVLQAESISQEAKAEILADLDSYDETYSRDYWNSTGRLARIGFPPHVATPIRNLRYRLRRIVGR